MVRSLKARELYDSMRQAIGGKHSKEFRDQDLANDALEQVASMHGWSFLGHGEAYVDLRGAVGFSGWNWTAASKLLAAPSGTPLSAYTFQPGDFVGITAGGALGYYKVASKPAGDASLVLETSIAAGNLAGTVGGQLEARTAVLPADFRELIDIGFDGGDQVATIKRASQQVVARYLRSDVPSISCYFACAERVVMSNGETRPLLRVAPISASNVQSAVHIVYERRIPALEGDNDVVRVPEYCYLLVKQVARAWIRSLEMPKTWGSFDEQMQPIMEGATFLLSKQADDGLSEEIGPLRGGHNAQYLDPLDSDYVGGQIIIGGPVTP